MFNDIQRVGFAGLGSMGAWWIASGCSDAGHEVIGWNRTAAKARAAASTRAWAGRSTPRELGASVDVLLSMLTDAAGDRSDRRRTGRRPIAGLGAGAV